MSSFLCQPCDHRWWQHRHPDPRMRFIGKLMIITGAVQIAVAVITIVVVT